VRLEVFASGACQRSLVRAELFFPVKVINASFKFTGHNGRANMGSLVAAAISKLNSSAARFGFREMLPGGRIRNEFILLTGQLLFRYSLKRLRPSIN